MLTFYQFGYARKKEAGRMAVIVSKF